MLAEAQRNGILKDELDPAKLVSLPISLAAWWFAVPQLSRMVTGSDGNAQGAKRSSSSCCERSQASGISYPQETAAGIGCQEIARRSIAYALLTLV